MKKRTVLQVSRDEAQSYCVLLNKVQTDIENLIYEIETETINSTSDCPQDIAFDVVPLLRRLRDAHSETKMSLSVFERAARKK